MTVTALREGAAILAEYPRRAAVVGWTFFDSAAQPIPR